MSTLERRARERDKDENTITVVGAGPSGLACANVLARSGRRVVVREWHAEVGSRFHGDFQGLENWSSEEDVLDGLRAAGIDPNFDHVPISEGAVFDAEGKEHRVRSNRPLYYLVRRGNGSGTIDRALLTQVRAAGADVRFSDRVGTVVGRSVLAGGPRAADAIAVGYLFETDMADGDWLVLDNRLAPLGYAYLLIHGGQGTVASCMFSGFKQQEQHVQRTLSFFRDKVGLAMRNPRRFGGFANFRLPRAAVQGGHPVVGEQAGFQDALAGFGLRYALYSGVLAARSIIDGADYEGLWRRQLGPSLRVGITNRFLFNAVGPIGWKVAIRSLSTGDAGQTLRRFYSPSLVNRLLFPIAQLRYRRVLRDPSCDHRDCGCVWCEHGRDAATVPDCGPGNGRGSQSRGGVSWKSSI